MKQSRHFSQLQAMEQQGSGQRNQRANRQAVQVIRRQRRCQRPVRHSLPSQQRSACESVRAEQGAAHQKPKRPISPTAGIAIPLPSRQNPMAAKKTKAHPGQQKRRMQTERMNAPVLRPFLQGRGNPFLGQFKTRSQPANSASHGAGDQRSRPQRKQLLPQTQPKKARRYSRLQHGRQI